MFLLIYKCRIAVSIRGKWFWKAWHCKLSLSDRLSLPADQKMPQSMMSDRQANSPEGQTLLPHFQTPERWELCSFGKVAAHEQEARGISSLGPVPDGPNCWWCWWLMRCELIQGDKQRSITAMKMPRFAGAVHCGSKAARVSDHVSVIKFAV